MLTLAFADGDTRSPEAGRKVNEWVDDYGAAYARAFSRQNLHWIDWPGVGVFAFSLGSREVRAWPEPGIRRETVIDIFSRVLRPVILQALGHHQALHAGAT